MPSSSGPGALPAVDLADTTRVTEQPTGEAASPQTGPQRPADATRDDAGQTDARQTDGRPKGSPDLLADSDQYRLAVPVFDKF